MRTGNCELCGQGNVYWKTSQRGKRYLYDVKRREPHFLTCPNSNHTQRQQAENVKAEETVAASVQPTASAESNGKPAGLTEAQIKRLIADQAADDRPDLIAAAVREAQRITVDKNRHESDFETLRRSQADQRTTLAEFKSATVAEIVQLTAEVGTLRRELAAKTDSAREIVIKRLDGSKVNVGRQHKEFEKLVAYLGADLLVFIAGPAGGGKTEAAKAAAKALGIDFYEQPLNPMLSESKLTGFMSANGVYVTTAMRKAFEFGGLLLLDEGDNANPAILAGMNALLANGSYGFPDKRVERHPNFRVILTANTWGHGADRQYVARNQLDAATLNRFVKLPWDYDEEFELAIAGNVEWTRFVQRVRRIVFQHNLRVVVSPRQSIFGAKLLAIGRPRAEVETAVLWADIPEDARQQIQAGLAA